MEDHKEPQDRPYPLRPSEAIRQPDFLTEIEPLVLAGGEKEKVLAFEKPLFEELQKLKDVSVSTHVIYPEAFASEEGVRLFTAIYLDEELESRLKRLAEERNVELKGISVKRKIYGAFFGDLLNIVDSPDDFQRYKEEGVAFENLSEALNLLGNKSGEQVVLKGDILKLGNLSEKDIEKEFFSEVDLTSVPRQLRTCVNRYSSGWAREQFAQAFQNADGDADKIPNPERITRIVNIDKLIEKVQGLRDFKKRLKAISLELGGEDNLAEAERMIISLYQRYVNVLIAREYDTGRILASQSRRTKREEEARGLLKGSFSAEQASRTMERMDHFLAGTGIRIGENGLFETVPEKLSEYAEARSREAPPRETPDYQKYNSYEANAQQAATLCEAILESYGLTKGDKPWKAVILGRRSVLGVSKKEREVRIPKSYKRGLVDTLAVLAHEVEGHVLRHTNQEDSSGDGLRLTKELATGRSGILFEAAAMRIEDDTRQEMVGVKREALPYYYLALLEKKRGGSFKECFQVFFEAHARRKYDLSLGEAVRDEKAYPEIFNYAYDRTLRIFGRSTPLDDKTGFLPISSQMQYIEQELVVDVLEERGLSKLLHVAGIDLYSIQDLRRLRMLDLSKVKEPEMVMAKEIWPQVKKSLDDGKPLEEAIVSLS